MADFEQQRKSPRNLLIRLHVLILVFFRTTYLWSVVTVDDVVAQWWLYTSNMRKLWPRVRAPVSNFSSNFV